MSMVKDFTAVDESVFWEVKKMNLAKLSSLVTSRGLGYADETMHDLRLYVYDYT